MDSSIVAVVVGHIVTIGLSLYYLNKHYITAPGYLGEQQKRLVLAAESANEKDLNEILNENINWLFVPITFLGKNAFNLLEGTKEGRELLIKKLTENFSEIITSPNALETLAKYPNILHELPEEIIIKHKDILFDIFLKIIDFFKENASKFTGLFAKLTLIRPNMDKLEEGYLINDEFLKITCRRKHRQS